MMLRCRFVTFDIVNTVLRVIGSPAQQYAEAARQCGLKVDEEKIASVYRPLYVQMKKDYPRYGIREQMKTKQWWKIFVKRVLTSAGYHTDETLLTNITDSLWEKFSEGANWEVLPHTDEVLKELKKQGFLMAAVSNFDERLESTLKRQNLLQYFDFCVTVVSSGLEKPDPRIFITALTRAEVNPAEAVHIGDDVRNDYIPAKSVGMKAFLLDSTGKVDKELDKYKIEKGEIITDIRQLPKRISLLE